MSAISPKGTVLRVSTTDREPVVLQFEGGGSVTLQLEVDSNCTCEAGAATRPGSYTDRDHFPSA
ncbi:hypothetical protein [Arthrobacter sp. ISL-30]|uniref:hypothetical protein n=1 Tax=Arthrobacter sp. ISL-30 TaxID=2819109 RepID=UPI001BEA2CD0|nr:hypothetical protein [Arthrobacter sp. ISL-30]MBT2514593.1 hypothetical protein [Arthrobacter sp. ISL-30]